MPTPLQQQQWDVIVVGGGLAGLSAAIYLGRALRRTLVVDDGRSLACWEPEVQNYLGFPQGVSGRELLNRGYDQAREYGVEFEEARVEEARRLSNGFQIVLKRSEIEQIEHRCSRLLLATGLFHLPPDVPGLHPCVGHSVFFCKDCDAFRVQDKRIAIFGTNDEAVEYALGMLLYSSCVIVATNGKPTRWDAQHARWVDEYEIPVFLEPVTDLEHNCGHVTSLGFGQRGRFAVDAIFTTRGDIYHNTLAKSLGAAIDRDGQILVDERMRTNVPGLYAAGCVTPANCQMIIAAGQGAVAAQAINRDLFEESLATHALRRYRDRQLSCEQINPDPLPGPVSSTS